MRKIWILGILSLYSALTYAQQDTVIVELTKSSKVIFTVQDRKDLDVLKHYNFQALFQDIITKLENKDTTALVNRQADSTATANEEQSDDDVAWEQRSHDRDHDDDNVDDDDDDDDDDNNWNVHVHRRRWHKTSQSFNFDLGTNNYLASGKFPESNDALYAVRPWGSWYVGLNSIQRTRMGKKFFLEWGLGISWYNFKFQNDNIVLEKVNNQTVFVADTRDVDFKKSKLTVSYLNASLVPVIDFGGHSRRPRMWDGYGNSFRMGLGPYVGYRLGSHSKIVYNDHGRERDKNRDNFYLNNFRYGVRLQLGYRSTDLFFNYDLNELFVSNKGPKLNAFSFGVIF